VGRHRGAQAATRDRPGVSVAADPDGDRVSRHRPPRGQGLHRNMSGWSRPRTSVAKPGSRRRFGRTLWSVVLAVLLLVLGLPLVVVAAYRFVPAPGAPLVLPRPAP